MFGGDVSPWVAFGAGMVSFLSPCVFPLLPIYVSYLTGVGMEDLTRDRLEGLRGKIFANGLLFILGFSIVFIIFGLSASVIGRFFLMNQVILRQIGGAVIVILGLHLSGIWKIPLLYREKRIRYTPMKTGYLNSLLMGMAFSIGWTPCTGPILGGILILAGASGSALQGAYLLSFYSLGMALPFLISALALSVVLGRFHNLGRILTTIQTVAGFLMVILGVMVFTGALARLSTYFPSII